MRKRTITLGLLCSSIVAIALHIAVCAGHELLAYFKVYTRGMGQVRVVTEEDVAVYNNLSENMTLGWTHKQVPPIVHRIWFNKTIGQPNQPLPYLWRIGHGRCLRLNQGWTYTVWTDNMFRDFMSKNYPWFLPEYDSYPYFVQRVDVAKYFLMYHFGGFYLDLDVGCVRGLEHLRLALSAKSRTPAMLPVAAVGFGNDVIAATRRHPFIRLVIDGLHESSRWYGCNYLTVLFSTGFAYVTLRYETLNTSAQADIFTMAQQLYEVMKPDRKSVRILGHMDGSTWHSWDIMFAKFLIDWKTWLCAVIAWWLWRSFSRRMRSWAETRYKELPLWQRSNRSDSNCNKAS